MLHVANGDAAHKQLESAELPGEIVPWSDILDQGPVVGAPATAEFRERRALFLAEVTGGEVNGLRAQLAAWDDALRAPSGETVLWFEADLNCQLALLHHLVALEANVSVVVSDTPVASVDPAPLLPQRQRFSRAAAERAWQAVAGSDPRAIERLDLQGLPRQMRPALKRMLQELPAPGSGLSRLERNILETEGNFREVSAREPVPWVTDVLFARLVTELHERGMFEEPDRTACLEGRLDYRTRAPDRWLGGVLLKGPRCFRFDGSRVIEPR